MAWQVGVGGLSTWRQEKPGDSWTPSQYAVRGRGDSQHGSLLVACKGCRPMVVRLVLTAVQ